MDSSLTTVGTASAVQTWDLNSIETPGGSRSPIVLHSEDPGRAVLVGLDAGQDLGDHQVKEHAWVLVTDGEVDVEAGGETLAAGRGTLLHFEPDERHAISARNGGARLLLLLAPWPGEGHYRDF
jgi:quercetin dioxygenase-like cupin family protein